jgi:hypothetical protein
MPECDMATGDARGIPVVEPAQASKMSTHRAASTAWIATGYATHVQDGG